MSNRTKDKPAFSIMRGGGLSLSGPALTELLQAVLSKGSLCTFQAKGHSMSPFIKDGDWVTVSPRNGSPPRFGDVVAFFQSGTKKLSIHRVIGKKGTFRFIKGDNTSQLDGLIPEANILGYVSKVERDGKRVYLGFGPERFLVALFSRSGLLPQLLSLVSKLLHPYPFFTPHPPSQRDCFAIRHARGGGHPVRSNHWEKFSARGFSLSKKSLDSRLRGNDKNGSTLGQGLKVSFCFFWLRLSCAVASVVNYYE